MSASSPGDLGPRVVQVRVAAASAVEVDTANLFRGWGAIRRGAKAGGGTALLCAAAGQRSDSSEEVIALLDEPFTSAAGSQVVTVRADRCFRVPGGLSPRAAADFPRLALTAAAALQSAGLPPGRAGVGTDSPPATVLIAGSSGRLPALLVEVLLARGARPCVAARRDTADCMRRLGAVRVLDHDQCSFWEDFGPTEIDAVLDCVGAESDASLVRETLGAAYVSLADPILRLFEEEGVLAGMRALWRRGQNLPVWSADDAAAQGMLEILEFIEAGQVTAPLDSPREAELAAQFYEYSSWARDMDTGLRYGFPGQSLWETTSGDGA